MLEKVLVRIIYYTSNVVLIIGVLVVGFPIIGKIFVGKDFPFINYCNSWSDLFGSYGFLKVLIITVVALIIYKSTKPFVIDKTKEEKPKDIPTPSIEISEQNNSDDLESLSNNFQEVLNAVKIMECP